MIRPLGAGVPRAPHWQARGGLVGHRAFLVTLDPSEVNSPRTCLVCGGEIGDDMAGRTICFGCGDAEVIPHRGTDCERCGRELEPGQLLDLFCPQCDGDGFSPG